MADSERLEELLVDLVTEGLPPAREQEMLALAAVVGEELRFDLERAAAAADLTFGYRAVEMPAALLERVRDQARGFVAASRGPELARIEPLMASRSESERRQTGASWPWLLAAAAVVLAVVAWWPRLQSGGPRSAVTTVAEDDIESDPALIALPLAGTEDPAARGASGTLEWSPALQVGRMRLEGLAVNDPAVFQYQLWIFDGSRDDRYPIDGGIFDVPGSGPLSVPVKAMMPVRDPTLFAVTVEPAGGVVVSSRERIVLVGQVG